MGQTDWKYCKLKHYYELFESTTEVCTIAFWESLYISNSYVDD